MRTILFILAVSASFLLKAQSFIIKTPTFIGKTQDEVLEMNKAYKNNLSSNINDSVLITLSFEDSIIDLNYDFMFGKNKTCVAYSVHTQDKKVRDDFIKEVEKKCTEKIADKAWVQKLDGKNYVWTLQGSETFFAVTVSQSK